MLAFFFGLVLGMLLAFALLGVAIWLLLSGGNRASAAHVLHAAALALKPKQMAVSNGLAREGSAVITENGAPHA